MSAKLYSVDFTWRESASVPVTGITSEGLTAEQLDFVPPLASEACLVSFLHYQTLLLIIEFDNERDVSGLRGFLANFHRTINLFS